MSRAAPARRTRVGLAVLGTLVVPLGIALAGPSEWRTSGVWVLSFGFAAALGIMLAVWRTQWRTAGAWAALVMVGQGAALSGIDAGPGVHFQHLHGFDSPFFVTRWIVVAVLLLQCVCLVAWGRQAGAALRRFVGEYGTPLRWALALAGWGATAAALSRDPAFFVYEVVVASTVQGLALLCLVAAAASLSASQADQVADWTRRFVEHRRLPFAVASWVLIASVFLTWFVYQTHPHVPDEVVYLLHARYFAAGLLDLPLPPVPAAFEMDLVTYDAFRWYVPVPPGWPAALAAGVWLGVPWLVNPVFGAVSVLLVHSVVRDLYGVRLAGVVACLLATSPWFLFLNMSLMTHGFTLVMAALAAWGVSKRVLGGGWFWTVLAGCGTGLVALNRPLEGLIAAAALGGWAFFARDRSWSQRVGDLCSMAAFSAAVVATTLPYNAYFTGDALTFPIMSYTDRIYGEGTNALGFGPGKGLGFGGLDPFPGHGIADVVVNSALNFFQINIELSGWSIGSTLPIVGLFLILGGAVWVDSGMVAAIGLVVVAHAFYWFSGGPDFGARYWYLAFVPLLVLVARTLQELARHIPAGRVAFATVLLMTGSLVVFTPWRATDKYWQYRGMEPGIRALALEHDWGADDVILVRGDRHPDYAGAAVYNPLDLRQDGPVYAWDRSEEVRAALEDAYPDRRFWTVDGPTVSNAGYTVTEIPTTASSTP